MFAASHSSNRLSAVQPESSMTRFISNFCATFALDASAGPECVDYHFELRPFFWSPVPGPTPTPRSDPNAAKRSNEFRSIRLVSPSSSAELASLA